MSRIGESLNFELGARRRCDVLHDFFRPDQPVAHVSPGAGPARIDLRRRIHDGRWGGEAHHADEYQVKNQSVYGCNSVRPVGIGSRLYFVQQANRKLRALAYKFETDAYRALICRCSLST